MIAGLPKRMLVFGRPLPVALLARPKATGFFIWFSVKDPCGKDRPKEKKRDYRVHTC